LGSWFWFWFWLSLWFRFRFWFWLSLWFRFWFGTRVLFRGLTLASVRDLDLDLVLVLVLVPDSYWGSWFGMSFWFGPCSGSVGGGDESAAILAAASVG
jgi:hypothetical protein